MKKMTFKLLSLIAFCILCTMSVKAQEDSVPKADNRPVRDPWACTMLIDNQTSLTISKGQLEFIIHHRFGTFDNGYEDLWGVYATSNIRIGFNYGITERIMIGVGTERLSKQNDIDLKIAILNQSRSGNIPVTVTYNGNLAIDGTKKDNINRYGINYKFSNRLSYFNQLIVSRKFNDRLSLQIAPSHSHFNQVQQDTLTGERYEHDVFGLSVGGRFKLYNETALMLEYNTPLEIKGMQETKSDKVLNKYKPNLAVGLEIGTSTHCFQVFLSSTNRITPQNNYVFHDKDISDFILGFNLTVRF